ncbi:hypothetical protein MTO96_018076 [Rhipicephalus appendiculatus]
MLGGTVETVSRDACPLPRSPRQLCVIRRGIANYDDIPQTPGNSGRSPGSEPQGYEGLYYAMALATAALRTPVGEVRGRSAAPNNAAGREVASFFVVDSCLSHAFFDRRRVSGPA